MKKYLSMVLVLMLAGVYVRPAGADSNGDQPETPVGMKQQPPVAGSPQTDAQGNPKLLVEFETDRWDIPASFSRNLDVFGKYLQQNPQSHADIIAYADHTGHGPANVTLSQKRADAVQKYIEDHYAISADRLKARGYGEVADKAHNITIAGKQANRRAYAMIVNPKS